jgi:hypothetical protein
MTEWAEAKFISNKHCIEHSEWLLSWHFSPRVPEKATPTFFQAVKNAESIVPFIETLGTTLKPFTFSRGSHVYQMQHSNSWPSMTLNQRIT